MNTVSTTPALRATRALSERMVLARYRSKRAAHVVLERSSALVQREPIAASTQCLERLQLPCGIELAAQPADQHFDYIAVAFLVVRIQVRCKLVFGNHAFAVAHEMLQQAILVRGEIDFHAIELHRLCGEIELERPAANAILSGTGR